MSTANQLSTSNSSSASNNQQTTQDPQVSTDSGGLNGQTQAVQSGTADNILTSTQGINLAGINSDATTSTTSIPNASDGTTAAHHAINPLLFTIAIIFFVVAIVLFATTTRSAKSTTN